MTHVIINYPLTGTRQARLLRLPLKSLKKIGTPKSSCSIKYLYSQKCFLFTFRLLAIYSGWRCICSMVVVFFFQLNSLRYVNTVCKKNEKIEKILQSITPLITKLSSAAIYFHSTHVYWSRDFFIKNLSIETFYHRNWKSK